jgi:restriction system protein
MSKPNALAYPGLVIPTLRAIRERGGSATIEEIEEGVARIMGLGDDVLSLPHARGSRTEFQYRLAWVRTYLKKVGALENSERAVWSLTDYGDSMSPEDARGVFQKVRAERRARRKAADLAEPDEPQIDDDEEDEESWIDQLLAVLGKMSPAAFERLSQRLLRESGFIKVEGHRPFRRWRYRRDRSPPDEPCFLPGIVSMQALARDRRPRRCS